MKGLSYKLPIVLFVMMALVFAIGLQYDPHKLPSALKGKPAPLFRLTTLRTEHETFTRNDLLDHVNIVNVWATWCETCRYETTVLLDIAKMKDVKLYGIDYKDDKVAATAWLAKYGNPFVKSGFDSDGTVALEWGVYGTPETFIVDRYGVIRYRHTGPLTDDVWRRQLRPMVTALIQAKGELA